MGLRHELHEMICEKFGSIGHWVWDQFCFETDDVKSAIMAEARRHVYYQPPASVRLQYPCVVYRLDDMPIIHANNRPYHWDHAYQLTVIDRDPESEIREKMAELPTCRFQRAYVADNLHHYVFRVYH